MGSFLSAPAHFLTRQINHILSGIDQRLLHPHPHHLPHHLTPANLNHHLKSIPPLHLITLTSLTTYLLLQIHHQHGGLIHAIPNTFRSLREWVKWSSRMGLDSTIQYYTIQIAKCFSWTRNKIEGEVSKNREEMVSKTESEWNGLLDVSATSSSNKHHYLPLKSTNQNTLLELMTHWSKDETRRWNQGQASGAIYHGDERFHEFLAKAYGLFALTNPLHPDLFPYVRKMEGEVVSMMVHLFNGKTKKDTVDINGTNSNSSLNDSTDVNSQHDNKSTSNSSIPNDCCGTLTSGGTESILLACKTYRDRGRDLFGITQPEIIAPNTIHAAFEKAAFYFGMKLILVDVEEDEASGRVGQVKLDEVKRAITRNTVLIAGSAPNFPHGIIDPIQELAMLAYERNIGFHSDCCLGGMILPFVEKLQKSGRLNDVDDLMSGKDAVPIFDFRAKGVTSISADMHKYGYAPKGSSVVMYSSSELRHYQYFVSLHWTGGIYASPTLAGSRPGGISAATWAAMVHLGEEGYLDISEDIIRTSRLIKRGIEEGIDGLEVIGNPLSSVVAFRSTESSVNIYGIGQAMNHKGWNLNSLQFPSCLHICCTKLHCGKADVFLKDLKESVEEVVNNPKKYANGSAAVYGMAHSIPDTSLLEPIAKGFVDAMFTA